MECKNCIHADVATKPRTIVVRGMTLTQNPGGVICTCTERKNMCWSNIDDDMRCSAYQRREDHEAKP